MNNYSEELNSKYPTLRCNHINDLKYMSGKTRLEAIKALSYVDEDTNCWTWRNPNGSYIDMGLERCQISHLSFADAYGFCPSDVPIVSTCGFSDCLNPEHLALSTPEGVKRVIIPTQSKVLEKTRGFVSWFRCITFPTISWSKT